MGENTFPTTRGELNSYLAAVVVYLLANQARLGISAANIAKLKALYGELSTADTYLYVYNLWSDEANTRTKTVIVMLETLEKNLKKHLSVIYNDIPDSIWTDQDRTTLNRKTGLPKTKSVVNNPITESCFVAIKPLSGGKVQLTCSTSNDKSLASKVKNSDGVMIAKRIVPPLDTKQMPDNELTSKIKHIALMSADDGTEKEFYSKTTFIIDSGTDNTGNYLLFYLRWYNSKHPNLAGPWTGPFEALIP